MTDTQSTYDAEFSNSLSSLLNSVITSAISDNIPDSVQTYLRGVVQSSSRPEEADLLTGANVEITQLYFSDDPDTNFPNTFSRYSNVVTSGSDINIASSAVDEEIQIIWGRHGSDRLTSFNSGSDSDNKRRIDFFVGDLIDEQLFGASPGPFRSWEDTFILGDWQNSYYFENDKTLGLNQFALITDFNPSEDTIQLHGTADDYQLVETSLGAAIFRQQEGSFDLIGVVGGVSVEALSLEGDYFDYQGYTAPETTIDQVEQIGTDDIDYLPNSDVDTEGNLYVGGSTNGSLAESNAGGKDAWLSKYDGDGNREWTKQFGTSEEEIVWDVTVDESSIYVTGNTRGELDNNANQGEVDLFLAKYDSDGNREWTKQFGTLTLEDISSVTTDNTGNIYVAGHTFGDLGGDNANQGQVLGQGVDGGAPSTDPFVIKLDSNGNELWRTQLGSVTLDDNWGVATDQDSNVFIGGNTKGDFGGKNASSAGEYDAWIAKLDSDGNQEWVEQFGTTDYDFLWDTETDSEGNLYATGWTLGDLGGTNAGSYDTWLAKYDTNGNQMWIKQFGTSGDDASFADGIEIDSHDNVFLTGYTDGNLGGTNAGSYDAWAAKYDSNGNQEWIQQFGTPDYDSASTVSADDHGSLYVSGTTDGSLGSTNAGSYDTWIAKLEADTGIIQNFGSNDGATNNAF
jgi:hypothetical protein